MVVKFSVVCLELSVRDLPPKLHEGIQKLDLPLRSTLDFFLETVYDDLGPLLLLRESTALVVCLHIASPKVLALRSQLDQLVLRRPDLIDVEIFEESDLVLYHFIVLFKLPNFLLQLEVLLAEEGILNLHLRHGFCMHRFELGLELLGFCRPGPLFTDHVDRGDSASLVRWNRWVQALPKVARHEITSSCPLQVVLAQKDVI